MQRTLVMIRHAKSSWANPLQSDFERPLNDRGEHDAPMMGQRLKKLDIIPDLVISSTAKRAKQTAKKIADELGYDKERIEWLDKLYQCIPSVFEETIIDLPENIQTVFMVAHNPGISEFVNELSLASRPGDLPTCAIVGVHVDAEQWSDFNLVPKEIFLVEYPKQFYDSK